MLGVDKEETTTDFLELRGRGGFGLAAIEAAVQFADLGLEELNLILQVVFTFAGTPVGNCIAGKFRTVRVPPFRGSSMTVRKTLSF